MLLILSLYVPRYPRDIYVSSNECMKLFLMLLRTLADYMRRLCNYVIEHRFGMFNWLFAVPLLHFLSKSSAPYCLKMLSPEPSSVKDDSWWGIEDLNLRKVRQRASTSRLALLY